MPWLVRDYWQALAAFGLFGVFHSLTAREPFKNALARRTSPFIVDYFWCLLYCLITFYWYNQILWTVWGLHPANNALLINSTRSLEVHGIYGWVRHPMLVGGLLFYVTQGPTLNAFVFALLYSLYMVIGSYYEERRLVRIFGPDYIDYRNRVGAFVPRLRSARILEG